MQGGNARAGSSKTPGARGSSTAVLEPQNRLFSRRKSLAPRASRAVP